MTTTKSRRGRRGAVIDDARAHATITIEALGRRLGRLWGIYDALGKEKVEIHKAANVKEIEKRVVERRQGTADCAIDPCVEGGVGVAG